jgi:hypothetical protein
MMAAALLEAGAAPLDQNTKAHLEGRWAAQCASSGVSTDFNPQLEIEFERSGGSLFSSDGIDIESRGRITHSDQRGRQIGLTAYYSDAKGAKADQKHLELIRTDQLALRGAERNGRPVVLRRCGKPNRQIVEHLSATAAIDLTLSKRGGAYFIEDDGKARCDAKPKSWLRFDLIGPTNYSVHRWGDFGDEWLNVSRASNGDDMIAISGTATIIKGDKWQEKHEERHDLRIRWLGKDHIRIEPWKASFFRCAY